MNHYTGRKIGIFTDAHALVEPTVAALIDMKKNNIHEIYSLGDNVGVGPNPGEVIELLRNYSVISIAGNSEEYCTLGIEPFSSSVCKIEYNNNALLYLFSIKFVQNIIINFILHESLSSMLKIMQKFDFVNTLFNDIIKKWY